MDRVPPHEAQFFAFTIGLEKTLRVTLRQVRRDPGGNVMLDPDTQEPILDDFDARDRALRFRMVGEGPDAPYFDRTREDGGVKDGNLVNVVMVLLRRQDTVLFAGQTRREQRWMVYLAKAGSESDEKLAGGTAQGAEYGPTLPS